MKKFAIGCLLGTTAMIAGGAEKAEDKVVNISNEDQEMNAAIAHARETLDTFLSLNAKPPKGASDFKLKVKFTENNRAEHMWVTPFERTEAGFSGVLADDPEVVTNVKNGQRVAFKREDVSDWGYVLNGRQVGSFTVCVIFKHMPSEEVQKYRTDYGFDC